MTDIPLPSGAVLKIGLVPFSDAMALNEAIAEELTKIAIDSETEMASVYKDLFFIGISSPKIKSALWKCMGKCIYNSGKGDLKIDKDSFEPEEARQDYLTVCTEVGKRVIGPFVKSHSAVFFLILEQLKGSQKSKPPATPS